MAKTTKAEQVPEESIREVQDFLEAKAKIDRLKESFPEVFETLDHLKNEYNAALQAADKKVRAMGVSCGPFTVMNTAVTYDADKLFEELGKDEFLRVGGVIKTVTQYEVDKAKLEAHITSNSVPQEVTDVVKKVSPRYKKPSPIEGI